MTHDQLYYPNITPQLTSELSISLLHWDRVMRIFPQKGTADLSASTKIMNELEKEEILVNEYLKYEDIVGAVEWFVKLMSIVKDPKNPQYRTAKSLVSPLRSPGSKYFIYRGKVNHDFPTEFPEYFSYGLDSRKNEIFFCSRQTGLLYMTLLTYFLNKRKNYSNTITDQPDAFPLFIVLNKIFNLTEDSDAINFEPIVKAAKQVEIFFCPIIQSFKA
jgi:hypothetical protein